MDNTEKKILSDIYNKTEEYLTQVVIARQNKQEEPDADILISGIRQDIKSLLDKEVIEQCRKRTRARALGIPRENG